MRFFRKKEKSNKYLLLLYSIGLCQLAGIIGSFFTAPAIDSWYATLIKPDFNPPGWVFGPVWITLYTLMGISLYLIIQKKDRFGVYIFLLHLILNSFWSIIFFGLHLTGVAFLEIMVLWTVILFLVLYFYKIEKRAAYLLVPYLAWVSFAAVLNYFLWQLN